MNTAARNLIVALAVILTLAAGQAAQAVLIATDTFESYTAGNTLDGQSGGSGWTSAWNINAGDVNDVTAESNVIPGRGLSLQTDTTTGNNSNLIQRSFPSQTGTVYAAFLLQTENVDQGDFLQFYFNNQTGASDTAAVSGGLRNQGSGGNNFYFARVDGTSNNDNTSFTHSNDQETLVVMRFINSPAHGADYDESAIFIDQLTEGTPDGEVTGVDSNTPALSSFHVRAFSFEGDELVFIDNLSIGTTYDEVVAAALSAPVPEPMTVGLAAMSLGALGMGLRRRRAA